MTADEEQSQDVVAILAVVEAIGRIEAVRTGADGKPQFRGEVTTGKVAP